MSPDGFLKSFTREIIDKTPDYLKTKILATLNEIFPHYRKPLYCGFGNRETDSVAYLRTNMDPERIFFITPKSIITKESKADFATSYVEML
jgi:phosphatidate phosphatase LPIN